MVERIQAVADSLTATEQKLVSALLTAPREVAIGTSSEFAARIGVHEATTSRLSKKLGFASYAGFRDALRAEYLRDAAPADFVDLYLRRLRDNEAQVLKTAA